MSSITPCSDHFHNGINEKDLVSTRHSVFEECRILSTVGGWTVFPKTAVMMARPSHQHIHLVKHGSGHSGSPAHPMDEQYKGHQSEVVYIYICFSVKTCVY